MSSERPGNFLSRLLMKTVSQIASSFPEPHHPLLTTLTMLKSFAMTFAATNDVTDRPRKKFPSKLKSDQ